MGNKNVHIKHLQPGGKASCLKNNAYIIDKNLFFALACVKISKQNSGINYILVAVNVLSRYLSGSPIRLKSSQETAKATEGTFQKKKLQKHGPIKAEK